MPPLRNTATSNVWGKLVVPYLPGSNGSSLFGYNFMRCPSNLNSANVSYGINYPYDNWLGGATLYKIPTNVFVATDYYGNYIFDSAILNPGVPNWVFNIDADGDGIKDSNSSQLSTYGKYNGFNPIHSKGGNFLFGDGHVKWVSLLGFIGNKDGIWGSTNSSDYR